MRLKSIFSFIIIFLLIFGMMSIALAEDLKIQLYQPAARDIIIYSGGFALIEDRIEVEFDDSGVYELLYYDTVPSLLPDSLRIINHNEDIVLPVLQQKVIDRKSTYSNMLKENVGNEVIFRFDSGREKHGRILQVNPELAVDFNGKIEFNPDGKAIFEEIEYNLSSKPIISWDTAAGENTDKGEFLIGYLAQNFDWQIDYSAEIKNDKTIKLMGNIGVENKSGIDLDDAALHIIAGDVELAQTPAPFNTFDTVRSMAVESDAGPDMVPEEVGEYYYYYVGNNISLPVDSKLQIPFVSRKKVQVEQRYVFPGHVEQSPLLNSIIIKNQEDKGLGIPLPEGTFRFYEDKEDHSLFIGASKLPHTPEGAERELIIGSSFDIEGERFVLERERLDEDKRREKFKVDIRNSKDEDVEVYVEASLSGNWYLYDSSVSVYKDTADRAVFRINIPAEEKKSITYERRQ